MRPPSSQRGLNTGRLHAGRRLGRAGVTLLAVAAAALVFSSGCTVWRMGQAMKLAQLSEPFARQGGPGAGRLLVVGDSTAVGTGASRPATSVAGLIARQHPGLEVVNRARDGARFVDIARQLEAPDAGRFDVVLVLGGGNDVIRLTRSDELEASMSRTLALARQRADSVILMPAGNVGNAPFFFPPWSWYMTRRSVDLHALARRLAATHGAIYVNMFQDKADDPFAREPRRMHAADGLHPSDEGYALWHGQLQQQARLDSVLAALPKEATR